MKLATVKKLLKQDPSTLSADQIGKLCLYNYFSEETDRGSIFGLDDLANIFDTLDTKDAIKVNLYMKMIASIRHMLIVTQVCYERAEKVLEMNIHALTVLDYFVRDYVAHKRPINDCEVITKIRSKYPIMLDILKEHKPQMEDALQTILAFNELIEIISEYYKEDLAKEVMFDVEDIEERMQLLRERAEKLRLSDFFKEFLFLHFIDEYKPNQCNVVKAKRFATKLDNYNTLLPTSGMLRVLTEGYDKYIK